MLPVKHRPLLFDVKGKSRAGKKDKREGKAVFMGSATGWHKGHRHALARLRLSHPEQARMQAIEQHVGETQLRNTADTGRRYEPAPRRYCSGAQRAADSLQP